MNEFNKTPEQWREISETEFVKGKFFMYEPSKIEFRQLTGCGVKAESGSPLINGTWACKPRATASTPTSVRSAVTT